MILRRRSIIYQGMSIATTKLSRICAVLGKYPEVLAVYLFGSNAEGRARGTSDYDLAVVSARKRSARSRRLDILADLAQAGIDDVDLVFLDGSNLVLSHEAVRANQLVFSRPEFDHGSFCSRIIRMYLDFQPHLVIQRKALKERIIHGAT